MRKCTFTLFRATWQGLPIRLINTHLESCWDQARVRTAQFSKAMEKLNEYSKDPKALLIFGGDLNIRDPEVSVLNNVVD